VAEDRVTMPDFHATLLHLLGLDHTRLTYRHAGRDYRLTDVSGEVLRRGVARSTLRKNYPRPCLTTAPPGGATGRRPSPRPRPPRSAAHVRQPARLPFFSGHHPRIRDPRRAAPGPPRRRLPRPPDALPARRRPAPRR